MTELQRIKPAPIRKTLRVAASPERAFDTFVAMGPWWLRDHSVIAQAQQTEQVDVVIEPHVGGRWYEVGANGGTYDWGRVVAFERPERLVLLWQLGLDFEFHADLETTVEVLFRSEGEHTVVEFEHRDLERMGENAAQVLESMDGGWGALLDRFASALA